jgi:predicted type IV restriction endonuclease
MASIRQIGSLLEKAFQKWDYQRAINLSENESQTRDYLIEPFFNLLGYNKMDHYSHEFSLKFSKGNVKKVDMVITLNGRNPIMLVECKKSNSNLTTKHFNQLAEYYTNHRESKLAILTNGIVYKFYSIKWNDDKSLNEEPFLVFDLNDFTRADLEDIAQFHIQMFNVQNIQAIAEEKYFLEDFDKALVKTLYPAGIELRKLVYQNMGGVRMTEKISNRIYDLINSISLQEAVEKVKVLEGKDSKSGVYTMLSEINAFQIIKTILVLTPKLKNHVERINYKDYKGHFKIIVDNMPSKEICYLVLSDNIKKIGFGNDSFILGKVSATEIAKHKKRLVEEALKYLS